MEFIQPLLVLKDNYTYVVRYEKKAIIIDPSASAPIIKYLEENHLEPSHILLTHGHRDHLEGQKALVDRYQCLVLGSDPLIVGLDHLLYDQDVVSIGPYCFAAWSTPGHDPCHMVFFLEKEKCLFSGDLIFGAGVGKLAKDTQACAKIMWESVEKVLDFSDDMRIYPGHEYTKNNLSFAKTLEPSNGHIVERLQLLEKDKVFVPFTLGLEKATNPFFRVSKIKNSLGMSEKKNAEVFWHIRRQKDRFSQKS